MEPNLKKSLKEQTMNMYRSLTQLDHCLLLSDTEKYQETLDTLKIKIRQCERVLSIATAKKENL